MERGEGMKRRYGLNMVWKMTIATMLLLLIPIFIICIIYIQMYQKTSMETADAKLTSVLGSMQGRIDETLSDADVMLDELFYRQEFSYFMNDKNELSQREINYYTSSVQKELINNRYLYSNIFGNIGLYSSNNQVRADWQFPLQKLEEKPYYAEVTVDTQGAVYGAVRESELVFSTLDTKHIKVGNANVYVLPIYKKVYAIGTKDVIGVVETDVDINRLMDVTGLRNDDSGITKMVADRKKNVLINTGNRDSVLEKRIMARIQEDKGTEELYIDGASYRMSYTVCPNTGLINIALLSRDDIYSNIFNMVIGVLLITVMCLGVMGIITYLVISNMLSRLVVVDVMMGKVREGHFDVLIPEDGKSDEISRIGSSFNLMVAHLNEVLEEKVRNEQAQKDAEIKALQAQINPHFLYNTLENMRMQCEIDGYYMMGNSLAVLGELFRYSIKWGNNEVAFELEWQNLKNYLYIMRMRYEDDLEDELECDYGLEDVIVPKMILQPLVENCFSHAFKTKMPPWKVHVTARREGDRLVIAIEDNGCGIEGEKVAWIQRCLDENKEIRCTEKQRKSIGILNVKQRIEMICKEGSKVAIESEQHEGTVIRIIIVL